MRGAGAARGSDQSAAAAGYRSRAEARNAAAREALVPLREGERPVAVTVGAVVALVSALLNAAYALGLGVESPEQPLIGPVLFSAVLLVMAGGMWRTRYWAVLGMQALLAISLIALGLFLILQGTLLEVALLVPLGLLPLGTLFWFLVKAMARIRMPERR